MKNKIKVLHIVGGMDVGGTETMLMNLYREVHDDIQFDFISYYDYEGHYDREIKRLGGQVIRVEPPTKGRPIKAIRNICNAIKKEGPYDVVHAHTLFNCGIAMVASKVAKVKVRIAHAHTNINLKVNVIKNIYFILMRLLILIFSTDYLACSIDSGKYLFGNSIVNNNKFKILPNYVAYEKYLQCNDFSSIRKEFGIDKSDIVVCHVGRFVDVKNHKFLIEVINEMIKTNANANVKAILVGDGVLKKDIERRVLELGIEKNIYFLGMRNDIENILNNSDLFVFTSTYEGLGLVIIEAQAAGVPCLVSEAIQPEANLDIGLVKQIRLDFGQSYWAEEAMKLIENKNKNKEIILKGIEDKGYDLKNIIYIILDIYKISLIQERRYEKSFNS